MNIPIPDRKYWAQRRAGKIVEKKKLPKSEEEKYTIEVDWWRIERIKEKQSDSLAGYEESEREKNKYSNQEIMNYDVPETDKTKLEQEIGNIIMELFYCATKSKNLRQEREQERKAYEEKEKEEYRKKLLFRPNEVKELFKIGKKISKIELGMTGSNMRTMILEDIIEKMVLHLGAFSKLVYHSEIKELDISMLATIARNIMECSNTYFYYAERKITDEEVLFRYRIANLHYDNSMCDIIQKLGFSQNNARTEMLIFGKKITRDDIKDSPIYKTLTKEEKS